MDTLYQDDSGIANGSTCRVSRLFCRNYAIPKTLDLLPFTLPQPRAEAREARADWESATPSFKSVVASGADCGKEDKHERVDHMLVNNVGTRADTREGEDRKIVERHEKYPAN